MKISTKKQPKKDFKGLLALSVLTAFLTACGSSGGGGNTPTGNDIVEPPVTEPPIVEQPNTAPTAAILFPTSQSLTTSNTITLRGTAADEEGDSISFLRVNGIDAQSDDGFATWQVQVPVEFGINELVVEVEDSAQNNNANAASVSVTQQPDFLSQASSAVYDPLSEEFLVVERNNNTLVAVNATTGARRTISSSEIGSGPALPDPLSVALDESGSCSSVLPSATRCALTIHNIFSTDVFVIDLSTGDRALITSSERGEGPTVNLPTSINAHASMPCPSVLEGSTHCALVADRSGGKLVALDLATGDRALISRKEERGEGLELILPRSVIYDELNRCSLVLDDVTQCALLVSSGSSNVMAVNLETGDRALISGADRGTGPIPTFPFSMVLAQSNSCQTVLPESTHCALVLDGNNVNGTVFAVDIATGDRAIFSDETRGSGADFANAREILINPISNQAVVVDGEFDSLVSVDLVTGDRTLLVDHKQGSGPGLKTPVGIHLAENSICSNVLSDNETQVIRCAIMADESKGAVLAVDLNTGDRAVISNKDRGTGLDLRSVSSMVLLSNEQCAAIQPSVTQCALILDSSLDALLLVDLISGNRLLVSGDDLGSGIEFVTPQSLTVAPNCSGVLTTENPCALVLDINLKAVLAVDLVSGDRAVVSDAERGAGSLLSNPRSIVFNENCGIQLENNPCVIVVDLNLEALIAVDLNTGNRVVITDQNINQDTVFSIPFNVVNDAAGMCDQVIESATNCVIVAEAESRALIAVDLDTGSRVEVFDTSTGNGPEIPLSPAMIFDAEYQQAVFANYEQGALTILDLVTLERIIISWSGGVFGNAFVEGT